MANEAQILENPTSTPAAVSTGYQRQNTNAVAGRVGMDNTVVTGETGKATLEISGPVDVNGVLYTIASAVEFTGLSTNRYYIYLDGSGDYLSPTIGTDPGTFDADKNARYTSGGYRVLNWVIDYDGSDSVVKRWIHPANTAGLIVDGDLEVGGDADVGNDLTVGGNVVASGYLEGTLGRKVTGSLSGNYSADTIFDTLSSIVPNSGDSRMCSGGFYYLTSTHTFRLAYKFTRSGANDIIFNIIVLNMSTPAASGSTLTITNGDSTNHHVELAW